MDESQMRYAEWNNHTQKLHMTFCKKQNCSNGEEIKGQERKTELPTKGQKGV